MSRPRVLVICADALGETMAGVAIRAYELARALAPHAEVTLAALEADTPPPGDVPTVTYRLRSPSTLRRHIAAADVVVAQPQWPVIAGWLRRSGARLILDVYDPEPFEVLEFLRARRPLLRSLVQTATIDRFLSAFHDGHHFMCAGDKQRDLWLGAMVASGLIGPTAYDRDPSFQSVIDAVPFGVPAEQPRASGDPGPRERFGLGADDELVLWSGGIWSWLDAPTAIRAAGLLAQRRPGVRLVFMGAATQGPARVPTEEARELARELGLLDETVFFNDRWVPYGRRADWLLQADCSISTHVEHLETRFAFRTRLLDCFWAGLPVVCTRGDDLAARVEHEGLGVAVAQSDPEAAAAALETVLERGRASYADRLARAAADFAWPRVAEPLVRWVAEPQTPPRLGDGVRAPLVRRARSAALGAALRARGRVGLPWPSL